MALVTLRVWEARDAAATCDVVVDDAVPELRTVSWTNATDGPVTLTMTDSQGRQTIFAAQPGQNGSATLTAQQRTRYPMVRDPGDGSVGFGFNFSFAVG